MTFELCHLNFPMPTLRFRSILLISMVIAILYPGPAVAKWSLTPRLYVEGRYDDNLFLTERNRVNDIITSISPGINLQYETPTDLIDLDYEFRRDIYSDFSEFNFSAHRGRLEARKDFFHWLGAGVREVFIRDQDPIELIGLTAFERPSSRTGRRNRYTRNIVEPDATIRFGERRSIQFGYRNQILRNDLKDMADIDENAGNAFLNFRFNIHNGIEVFYEHINLEYGTTFPPEPDRDHKGDEVRGRYTYYFDPRTSAFVQYRYYHRDFERQNMLFGLIDYEVHDPRLGFSRDLYENISLTISAGYALADAETRRKEETFSGRGDFNARYKHLTTNVYGEAGFDQDFLSGELLGFYKFWRAGINGGYELFERLWLEAFLFFERDKFTELRRKDDIWSIRGRARYHLWRWFFISFNYEYNERDSNIPDESYKDNRYIGRITAQYDVAEHFQ